jgi:hypothetical protein
MRRADRLFRIAQRLHHERVESTDLTFDIPPPTQPCLLEIKQTAA